MHRSSSNTRVADEYYRNSSSSFSSPATGDADSDADADANLPIYSPGSESAKKEKSRLRSAENAVHLIPLVLVLCAIILWFFSNPVDVVNKEPDVIARVEGLKAAGGVDVDGTQNSLLAHLELEDDDLANQHLRHRQTTERKPSI